MFFSLQQKGAKEVSPGQVKGKNSVTFVNEAEKYQLPEYTTGFLLAKNISIKFRGIDSSMTYYALQQSASASLSGGFGCFSVSASFDYGHSYTNLKVSSTSDGLQIDIPGAQIIGYYTSVLPKFPNMPSH